MLVRQAQLGQHVPDCVSISALIVRIPNVYKQRTPINNPHLAFVSRSCSVSCMKSIEYCRSVVCRVRGRSAWVSRGCGMFPLVVM